MDKSKNILLVDDEELIVNLLQDYLESLGYGVAAANSAEEAIKILNNGSVIDLLITDINLPGMTGIDLLKIARNTKKDVSVILITGMKTLNFAISAIQYGAQDYITKPFDLENVRRVVEKVLRKQRHAKKKEEIFEYSQYIRESFEIPTAEVDAGSTAEHFANILLKSGFCTEDDYNQLKMAFTETILNAVEHGNLELSSELKEQEIFENTEFENLRAERLNDPRYANRKIYLTFEFQPENFSLNITDEGKGFNWQKYVDEKHQPRMINLDAHGRGFIFIKHIIDEVYFNDRGNSITLVKHRKAEYAPAQ